MDFAYLPSFFLFYILHPLAEVCVAFLALFKRKGLSYIPVCVGPNTTLRYCIKWR